MANAVMGNALGVVVTPALLLVALKDSAIVFPPLAATMRKLSARVVLPVAIGRLPTSSDRPRFRIPLVFGNGRD